MTIMSNKELEITQMKKLITMCAVVGMILAVSGVAQATIGHFDGFENEAHSWNEYNSQLERVSSGTDGITSAGGNYHLKITDNPEFSTTGAYTFQGGTSDVWGGGWSSSIDVYIDIADSHIDNGTYFWNLSQGIYEYQKDNIFHLGAVSDGSGGYVLGVNSGHTGSGNSVLSPANYHGESYGTFTANGWYTFVWEFGPSTSTQHPDNIDVTWTVLDDGDNIVWNASETCEGVLESVAGGNHYLWFTDIGTDQLLIDNATVIPEPATMALLGLGGLLIRRKRRA